MSAKTLDAAPQAHSEIRRLETFCDGIFAIAITLLVLEIKVPTEGEIAGLGLGPALLARWPSYFAYVLSFALIGAYWVNHHWLFKLLARIDHRFNLLTLLLMLAIGFLPFPTAVLGHHLLHAETNKAAVSFYALALLIASIAWALGWRHASRSGLVLDELEPDFLKRLRRRFLRSVLLHLAALLVSLVAPWFGLVAATLLALLYLSPPPPPQFRQTRNSEFGTQSSPSRETTSCA
jgi:uncharacterized membrane protein